VIEEARLKLSQVINYEKKSGSGFLPRIRRLFTTLHVKPATMEPPRGSLKGLLMMNGRRQALSYGPTGIVRLPQFSSHHADDLFRSWIWQKHTMVGIMAQHLSM
jgi:hypothetical protein